MCHVRHIQISSFFPITIVLTTFLRSKCQVGIEGELRNQVVIFQIDILTMNIISLGPYLSSKTSVKKKIQINFLSRNIISLCNTQCVLRIIFSIEMETKIRYYLNFETNFSKGSGKKNCIYYSGNTVGNTIGKLNIYQNRNKSMTSQHRNIHQTRIQFTFVKYYISLVQMEKIK